MPSYDELTAEIKAEKKNILTRFAPAPTGMLHLGHAVSAVYVWGLAAACGGRVLLRIEDHDRERSRPEYEEGILEDLIWLGFLEEETPDEARLSPLYSKQSERTEVYKTELEKLKSGSFVYACSCSRKEIRNRSGDAAGEAAYDGFCRKRNLPDTGGSLRIKLSSEAVEFEDLRLGKSVQHPSLQCGDLQLRDRKGNWTYQFACTVDDMLQGVNLVIRGEDLFESTGRQILLMKKAGRSDPPFYFHHPLLFDKNGEKLSKQIFSETIASMREKGAKKEEILGKAAFLCGLLKEEKRVLASDLSDLFADL